MCLTGYVLNKDDADRLDRALASMEDVVGRLIVVDTGSTDASIEVAQSHGAEVFAFDWCDDFAAAHNYALALIRSEWVLSLDSDEFLLPRSATAVRDVLGRDDIMGCDVRRRDYRVPSQSDHFAEMWQRRLFRRRDSMRYVGRCHHQMAPPLEELAAAESRHVVRSDIVIGHEGYAATHRRAKLERGIRLMTRELEDRPGQFYYLVELGLSELAVGRGTGINWLQAAAEQAMDPGRRPGLPRGPLLLLLEWVIAGHGVPNDFPLHREDAARWARLDYGDAPPLVWQFARFAYARGDFEAAAVDLDRLLEFGRTKDYDRTISFDPRIVGDEAALNRAACDLQLGRLEEAERRLKPLLDCPSVAQRAEHNLAEIERLRKG